MTPVTDNRPSMLIILDGWGLAPPESANAVTAAATPALDHLADTYPATTLRCSGEAVGLPPGIMGNSEVGHLNIGAGRIVFQDLLRIDRAIADGSFFETPALTEAVSAAVGEPGATLHFIGLLSDAGVHSHFDHLLALIELAKRNGVNRVRIHAIMDGRDTPPDSGQGFIHRLAAYLRDIPQAAIASICGRFYAMDRDTRWDRIEKAYRLYTVGEGIAERDAEEAVRGAYERGESDEFIQPIALTDNDGRPLGVIEDRDAVVFFNFRADRAREMTRALTAEAFSFFDRPSAPRLSAYVGMTTYDEEFSLPAAFPPVHLKQIMGEVVSRSGLRQLRIAETEKYAHVTYFFNGGEETPFEGEDRCLIPSPREVKTYDLKPEMSAHAVADELVSRIRGGAYQFIVVNFANMDMVGHTGNFDAAVRACEAVDACVNRIVKEWRAIGGSAIVTADHGNAEKMKAPDGSLYTAHTTHPVPLILVDDQRMERALRPEGILADISPTLLELMGLEQPPEMTGVSLLRPASPKTP
jgi:2,3-bisphosphoglycerate-independent phosphoglycerate mutase